MGENMAEQEYTEDFEKEQHTQAEFDEYEKWKIKQGKAGSNKVTDYKTYQKNLKMRNLAFNFKNNVKGVANAVTPILKKMGENAAANSEHMMVDDSGSTKKKKKGN